jgi:putative hydrolase of the HAD superfamily
MAIKAVIFDLDDTLVVDEAVSREALQEVAGLAAREHGAVVAEFLEWAGVHSARFWEKNPARAWCEGIGISFEECLYGNFDGEGSEGFCRLREWALEARPAFFDAVLRELGISDEESPDRLAAAYVTIRRRKQRLMPDAREVLARLRADGFLVALLTNGAPSIQQEKITDAGFDGAFDQVVISGDFGIGKPLPEVFQHLFGRLGLAANETVMVGNSLKRDILGARNAGCAAGIWLRVAGSEELADVAPDYEIAGLHEVPALVAAI